MRAVAFSIAVFLTAPATAQELCTNFGDTDSSPIYRLCPGGVVYEKEYLYYGVWSDWKRLHPSIAPPCVWAPKDNAWYCAGRIISCAQLPCR